MPVHNVTTQEELTALLDELFGNESKPVGNVYTTEEAYARYREACRMAYDLARNSFDPKPTTKILFSMAYINTEREGVCGATGALLMEAFRLYIDAKQQQNPDLFKTELIQALDDAVIAASDLMKEHNDTCTKPSAS